MVNIYDNNILPRSGGKWTQRLSLLKLMREEVSLPHKPPPLTATNPESTLYLGNGGGSFGV